MDRNVSEIELWADMMEGTEELTDSDAMERAGCSVIALMELARDGRDVAAFKAAWHHFNLNRGVAFESRDVKFGEQETALAKLYEDEKQARALAKLYKAVEEARELAKLYKDEKQARPLAKLDEDEKQTRPLANFIFNVEDKEKFAINWIKDEVRKIVQELEDGGWRKEKNPPQNGGEDVKDKAGRTGTNDMVGCNVLCGGGRKGAKDGVLGEEELPELIRNALPAIYPGRTALHMAAANGNLQIVEAICKVKNVDLNKKDVFGYTPLHLACYSLHDNRDKVIKTLLSRKSIDANVVAKVEGYYLTALHLAVKARSNDVVDMLLDWDPQRKNDSKVLDVDARSRFRLTAFHIAVKEALKAKDPTERDDFVTMIVGFIRFMNKHSPEAINKRDKTKSTPLHTCVEAKDYELVELLLEDGDKIDPELLDAKGRTALEIAVQQREFRMVRKIQLYLERAGLFGNHEAYVESANAILVGAALLATVTFTAWVQFPTSTLFWVFISFSFYFAIATFIAAAGAAIPSAGSTLGLVRRAVLASAICLQISLGCAVAAFATAGFLILPPGKPHRKVIATTAIGGFVCFFFLLTFLRKITRAIAPSFLKLDYIIQSQIKESIWKLVTEGVTSRLNRRSL